MLIPIHWGASRLLPSNCALNNLPPESNSTCRMGPQVSSGICNNVNDITPILGLIFVYAIWFEALRLILMIYDSSLHHWEKAHIQCLFVICGLAMMSQFLKYHPTKTVQQKQPWNLHYDDGMENGITTHQLDPHLDKLAETRRVVISNLRRHWKCIKLAESA